MPNMYGGDQDHPAYKPRELKENEVLIQDILYTISFDEKDIATISCEKVDGKSWIETEKTAPVAVKEMILFLRGKSKSNNVPEYSQMIIGKIFSRAETILSRIKENAGGYLALYQIVGNRVELLQIAKLGSIKHKEIPDFGTESKMYQYYAQKKCLAIFECPSTITSGKTSFSIKGAIKMNNSLLLGFSGEEQDEDEALVVATTRSMKHDMNENNVLGGDGHLLTLDDIRKVSDNPMLSDENITKLIKGD